MADQRNASPLAGASLSAHPPPLSPSLLYGIRYTLYGIYCTVCGLHCMVYTVPYTVYPNEETRYRRWSKRKLCLVPRELCPATVEQFNIDTNTNNCIDSLLFLSYRKKKKKVKNPIPIYHYLSLPPIWLVSRLSRATYWKAYFPVLSVSTRAVHFPPC